MRELSNFLYLSLSSTWYLMVVAAATIGCAADSTNGNDPGNGPGNEPGGGGWRALKLPTGKEQHNVTGIYCSDTNKCVVAANQANAPGAIYAASATTIGDSLIDGLYMGPISKVSDVFGDIGFIGFQKSRDKLIARLDVASAFVTATGDITQKSSWTAVNMGKSGGESLPLSFQGQIALDAAGKAVLLSGRGFVYTATGAPGPTANWTKVWSPTASPSVPADFSTQFAADPTLCNSDVTISSAPTISNPAYINDDASFIIHPAGGMNQSGTAKPGVCVSTDKGKHFYSVPFTGVPTTDDAGPHGVVCTDNNHCIAIHALDFVHSPYIYVTNNAAMGKSATWSRSTLPEGMDTSEDISLRGAFFAPDGIHGWCVGDSNRQPLMLVTTDGGKTWTDRSDQVQGIAEQTLNNGFALDKDHVWIGGRLGTLIATDSAQK